MKLGTLLRNALVLCIAVLLLPKSVLPPGDDIENIRAFTRQIEFDYVNWTLDALYLKAAQSAFNPTRYLDDGTQKDLVLEYLALINQINQTETQIETIYADPSIENPDEVAAPLLQELSRQNGFQNKLGPLVESVLQQQISATLDDLDIAVAGQPIPPLLFHSTPLPVALIVSPRDQIRQDADISLLPDLTLEQITDLEKRVEEELNMSALVVNIGGMGLYPTMILSTSNFPFLIEVISHEWIHNYLTLHPLGLNYETSPELRTINETTANLSGKEIQQAVFEKFYPEELPEPVTTPETPPAAEENSSPQDPPPFDFRAEMHQTRVTVDALLEEGKIEEAEHYMEQRRQIFVANGYRIRKLNQAYFAFHGAYADEPGGAAGSDPVGPAVRELRENSDSLAAFLHKIAWVTSFDRLQAILIQQKALVGEP